MPNSTTTYTQTEYSFGDGNGIIRINRSGGHISWDDYFMSVAILAAQRSKDPCTKVGACIVNKQNRIVATGYNGMPNGIDDNSVPWTKEGSYTETKYAYVVHAELNAILNRTLTDQPDCRLYVTLFPCNECAKAIVQSNIRHVIYQSDKHKDRESTKAAKKIFELAGIVISQIGNNSSSKQSETVAKTADSTLAAATE